MVCAIIKEGIPLMDAINALPAEAVIPILEKGHDRLNRKLFGGKLSTPDFELFDQPEHASSSYKRKDGRSVIGVHSACTAVDPMQALSALSTALLHEMVHQYVTEILGFPHANHGPTFIAECNRIAETGGTLPRCESISQALTWPVPSPVDAGPPKARVER